MAGNIFQQVMAAGNFFTQLMSARQTRDEYITQQKQKALQQAAENERQARLDALEKQRLDWAMGAEDRATKANFATAIGGFRSGVPGSNANLTLTSDTFAAVYNPESVPVEQMPQITAQLQGFTGQAETARKTTGEQQAATVKSRGELLSVARSALGAAIVNIKKGIQEGQSFENAPLLTRMLQGSDRNAALAAMDDTELQAFIGETQQYWASGTTLKLGDTTLTTPTLSQEAYTDKTKAATRYQELQTLIKSEQRPAELAKLNAEVTTIEQNFPIVKLRGQLQRLAPLVVGLKGITPYVQSQLDNVNAMDDIGAVNHYLGVVVSALNSQPGMEGIAEVTPTGVVFSPKNAAQYAWLRTQPGFAQARIEETQRHNLRLEAFASYNAATQRWSTQIDRARLVWQQQHPDEAKDPKQVAITKATANISSVAIKMASDPMAAAIVDENSLLAAGIAGLGAYADDPDALAQVRQAVKSILAAQAGTLPPGGDPLATGPPPAGMAMPGFPASGTQ